MNLTVDIDIRRIKLHRGDDIKFYRRLQGYVWELYCPLSMYLNLFRFRVSACFAYDKTVISQRRVEKSDFEDKSEENSVWIIKWRTLLGIFCKISFTPTFKSCYQVHADAHLFAALLCNLGATGAFFFLRIEVSLRVCMPCLLRKGAHNHYTWITADEV